MKVTRVKWSTWRMQHPTMDDHRADANLFGMVSLHPFLGQTHKLTLAYTPQHATAIVLAQLFCFDAGMQKWELTLQSD